MARIVLKHLTGSRANTTEIYPTNRFQSLYLGRDPSCDVQFDADKDDLVSRSHAVVEWQDDDPTELTLSDLLSSNGTFLNGKRVHGAVPLKSGDKVQLGSTGPSMIVELEATQDAQQWETSEHMILDTGKRTRQGLAVPDERDPDYEEKVDKLKKDASQG